MPQIVVREIRSRGRHPNWDAIQQEVVAAAKAQVVPALIEYHERIVTRWRAEHQPGFASRVSITPNRISIYVFPDRSNPKGRQIWEWLREGTRPHIIEPKKAGYPLRFQTGYKPFTNTTGGYKGPGKAFGPVAFAKKVRHPGIKPRRFDKWIARWYKASKRWPRDIENAFRRGVRRAKREAKNV